MNSIDVSRRSLLSGAGGAAVLAAGCAVTDARQPVESSQPSPSRLVRFEAQTQWVPEPPEPQGMVSGLAPISPARLWYWDTAGKGEAVVLLHAATGSAACWAYQRDALVRAGYRVIGYSRRGHAGSERGPDDAPGRAVDDLLALVDYLDVDRFHIVGTAAGGFVVPDFALSHGSRLLSLTMASSLGGNSEGEFTAASRPLTPPEFSALSSELKEVGPSYRAANPQGLARWVELEHQSKVGERVRQERANRTNWESMRTLRMPAFYMTGDADMYLPPALLRLILDRLPGWRGAIISEAGHAAYWEQPEAFNAALIGFLKSSKG